MTIIDDGTFEVGEYFTPALTSVSPTVVPDVGSLINVVSFSSATVAISPDGNVFEQFAFANLLAVFSEDAELFH